MGSRRIRLGHAIVAAGMAFCLCTPVARAAGPDATRFGHAMEVGDLRAAARWLDEGLDPDFEADSLGTGLMIGAWEGNIPLMELFLSRGADINHVSRISEQALMLAAWKGHEHAVRWLVEHGAEVNRAGKQWSALHYATFAGHEGIFRFLLARGADVNARTTNDSTALMLTARQGHEDLARLLLQAGADPKPANDWGDTALTWAMSNRNLRIARLVAAALDAVPDAVTPPSFAEAVQAPPGTFAAPAGSVPAPPEIDDLLQRLRLAEAQRRPTKDLRRELFEAIARFKAEATPAATAAKQAAAPPKALVVTAKRAGAGRERAELVYDHANAVGAPESAGVSEILARIRQAQAQRKPVGELREALFAAVTRFKGERPALAEAQSRPSDVSEILQQLQQAEATGRPVEELRSALREAVERFKRAGPAPGEPAR